MEGNDKLKILLVHNFYGSSSPSGENQVFEAEKNLLLAHGHEVSDFIRYSDEIRGQGAWGMLKGALATPWNPWMARKLRRAVLRLRPDVVHVHNTFPLISPAIYHAIGENAAKVLTLHNYRLFCPAGIPMRAGKVCTDCMDSCSTWPAFRFACYRRSRLATLPLAFGTTLHRTLGTWDRHVDSFIVLSEFQRQRMTNAGLPAGKIYFKPNFYPGMPKVVSWHRREPYVVYAGRLSAEKGVASLLRAWKAWGANAPELRIVGQGEILPELKRMVVGLPVRFLGQLSARHAQIQIAGARLLVLPSECFEGFPMVVREAFAFGTPAAVSNLGPLPDIVQHGKSGLVFEAANPDSLLNVVRDAWLTPGALEQLGFGARIEFETKYTEDANYRTLMSIYERAIETNRESIRI